MGRDGGGGRGGGGVEVGWGGWLIGFKILIIHLIMIRIY